jgi:hypothetical protein
LNNIGATSLVNVTLDLFLPASLALALGSATRQIATKKRVAIEADSRFFMVSSCFKQDIFKAKL